MRREMENKQRREEKEKAKEEYRRQKAEQNAIILALKREDSRFNKELIDPETGKTFEVAGPLKIG